MQQRELARLAIKIAGLVSIVFSLVGLPTAFFHFNLFINNQAYHAPPAVAAEQTFFPVFLSLLTGVFLYWAAGPIVDKVLRLQRDDVAAPRLDLGAIEQIAVSVLGIYVFTTGIAEGVFYWGKADLFYRYVADRGFMPPALSPENFAGFGAAATRIIVGLALFFGSEGIANLRHRLLTLRSMRQPD